MAKQYYQFQYSANPKCTFIEGSFPVGTAGAVNPSSAFLGAGINGVSKITASTGTYSIQFQDNFNRFLDFQATAISPTSGAGTTQDGSFIPGRPYQIVFPSTSTNWVTVGVPSNVQAAIGVPFVASSGASKGPSGSSGATAAGNGLAVQMLVSGVSSFEVLPNPNTTVASNTVTPSTAGGYLLFQCLDKNNSPVNPTSGTVIRFNVMYRGSSLVLNNETPTNY